MRVVPTAPRHASAAPRTRFALFATGGNGMAFHRVKNLIWSFGAVPSIPPTWPAVVDDRGLSLMGIICRSRDPGTQYSSPPEA